MSTKIPEGKLSGEELLKLLKTSIDPNEIADEDYKERYGEDDEDDEDQDDEDTVKLEDFGPFKEVHSSGFHENEDWWGVFYFERHDVYIQVSGYYTSYDGVSADKIGPEVFPKEKTITVYVTKDKL